MRYLEQYRARETEVEEVLRHPGLALLATPSEPGPDAGLFPFVHRAGHIELHLERSDVQVAHLEDAARGTVVVSERLATIPSYWVHPDNVLFADAYHRTVVVRGAAQVLTDPATVWEHLEAVLLKYQGDRATLDAAVPRNHNAADRLVLVRIEVDEVRSKFKLGQQEPEAVRRLILEGLRRRGTELDLRTADLVEGTLAERRPASGHGRQCRQGV